MDQPACTAVGERAKGLGTNLIAQRMGGPAARLTSKCCRCVGWFGWVLKMAVGALQRTEFAQLPVVKSATGDETDGRT